MLPPVLEIYVVWHPQDQAGQALADALVEHFHGTPFTGLIGGAVEVFVRSAGWLSHEDAPRPLPLAEGDLPTPLERSAFIAVVPMVGNELAFSLEGASAWRDYIARLMDAQAKQPDRVFVFPYELDAHAMSGGAAAELLGGLLRLAASAPEADGEDVQSLISRDLAQGLAQHMRPDGERLTVFISHTKRAVEGDAEDTADLIQLVRHVIGHTRLNDFFDASDLQPGEDWAEALRVNAAKSALLAIRTDLYPSRPWCQREIRIAKQAGMPVIFMDAPGPGEERGSFLMDHVPRIPVGKPDGTWAKRDVYRALNLLADECLKRVLWVHQERLATEGDELPIAWWAPHAPEPLTLVHWLLERHKLKDAPEEGVSLVILHPDPPLGPDERLVLDQMMELTGRGTTLDIMTPRLLAARGG